MSAIISTNNAKQHANLLNNSARGKNFSPPEDLALSRAWGSATQIIDDVNNDRFWEHVSTIYHKQPEATSTRSVGGLQARFQNVAKISQKYLAAEKLYRSQIPSGETEEDTVVNIMTLYRKSNQAKVRGLFKIAPEIKFLPAVRLLGKLPKFSMVVGAAQTKKRAQTVEEDDSALSSGNISASNPAISRPKGVKKLKLADQNSERLAQSVEEVAAALRTSADVKKTASSIALQLKILKSIDLPQTEKKNSRLEKLLAQANGLKETPERSPDEGNKSTTTCLPTQAALLVEERRKNQDEL